MINYKNLVIFKKDFNGRGEDINKNIYSYKERRECLLTSIQDGSVFKYMKISVLSASDIDLDTDVQDIMIELFQKDNLTGKLRTAIEFDANPSEPLYEVISSFANVTSISERENNLNSNITVSKVAYIDGTIALRFKTNSSNTGTIKIELDPSSTSYFESLELFRKLQEISVYDKTPTLPKMM